MNGKLFRNTCCDKIVNEGKCTPCDLMYCIIYVYIFSHLTSWCALVLASLCYYVLLNCCLISVPDLVRLTVLSFKPNRHSLKRILFYNEYNSLENY